MPEGAVGMVLSYPAYVTSSLPSDTLIFGNFRDLIIASFGAIDLQSNPYGRGWEQATVSCRIIEEADIGVRRDSSFAIVKSFDIS